MSGDYPSHYQALFDKMKVESFSAIQTLGDCNTSDLILENGEVSEVYKDLMSRILRESHACFHFMLSIDKCKNKDFLLSNELFINDIVSRVSKDIVSIRMALESWDIRFLKGEKSWILNKLLSSIDAVDLRDFLEIVSERGLIKEINDDTWSNIMQKILEKNKNFVYYFLVHFLPQEKLHLVPHDMWLSLLEGSDTKKLYPKRRLLKFFGLEVDLLVENLLKDKREDIVEFIRNFVVNIASSRAGALALAEKTTGELSLVDKKSE